MMSRSIISLLGVSVMLGVAPVMAADCEGLAKFVLPATTITTAQTLSDGLFKPPTGDPITKLPEFCRVAGVIKPSDDSHIQFEVWMPAAGWNGKFQGVGNGGFAGSISYGGLADAVRTAMRRPPPTPAIKPAEPTPVGRLAIGRRSPILGIVRFTK